MNALVYYENISFEEKINGNNIQLIITVNDKKTESEKIIFNKTITLLVFIPLLITIVSLLIPAFFILFSIKLIGYLLSFFKKEEIEMSYQETKDYFNAGKGYLNNLSHQDKEILLSKKESISLGL
jgi:hypothetical protein